MRIGILGSGLMGGKLGTLLARAGHDVVFSYARSEQKLKRLARGAGKRARAGTPAHAARESDVLLLAVHWTRVNDVLKQAGALRSKIVVSCSLPMNASDTALVVAHTSSGAEVLARWLRGAHFVSAFGTVPSVLSLILSPVIVFLVIFTSVTAPVRSFLFVTAPFLSCLVPTLLSGNVNWA